VFPPVESQINIKMVRPKQSSVPLPRQSRLRQATHMSGHTSRHMCRVHHETRIGRLSKRTRHYGYWVVASMIVDEYLIATDTFARTTP